MISIPTPDCPVQPPHDEEIEMLLEACIKGDIKELKAVLERGCSLRSADAADVTPLHLACLNGHTQLVEFILSCGNDVDVNALGGEHLATPLYWATSQHHLGIVAKLLDNGGNPSIPDESGHDCLFLATMAEDVKLVALFAAHGAPVDAVDKNGFTPLQWLLANRKCSRQTVNMIRTLLVLQPECLHTKHKPSGNTPLHFATAADQCTSCLRTLLKAGAQKDARVENTAGKTPLQIAWDMHSYRISHLLEMNWLQTDSEASSLFAGIFFTAGLALPGLAFCFATFPWYWSLTAIVVVVIMFMCVPACMDGADALECTGLDDPYNDRSITASTALAFGVNFWSIFWLAIPYFAYFRNVCGLAYNVLFWTGYTGIVVCLFRTVTADPAISSEKLTLPQRLDWLKMLARQGKLRSKLKFCPTSLLPIPARGKYCVGVRKIVSKYDHYCPFVYNSVGAANHRYFVGFLISTVTTLTLYVCTTMWWWCDEFAPAPSGAGSLAATQPVTDKYGGKYRSGFDFAEGVMWEAPVSLCCVCLALLHCLWIGCLLYEQLEDIWYGVTQNEAAYLPEDDFSDHPYYEGPWRNCSSFWGCGSGRYAGVDWNEVHFNPLDKPRDKLVRQQGAGRETPAAPKNQNKEKATAKARTVLGGTKEKEIEAECVEPAHKNTKKAK